MVRQISFRKKIGLALGGGGARGIAHIGVLQFLMENNVKIEYLSGTSMGALIGALFASGMDPEEMQEIVNEFSLRDQIRLIDVGLPHGLIKGNKIIRFLEKYVPPHLTFEKLKMPFAVTAVDLMSGDLIIINKGSVLEAVRASISYPFFFQPVIYGQNQLLVDGGLLMNIPITPLWDMGANFIIAVRVSHFLEFEEKDNILRSRFLDTPSFIKILLRSLSVTSKTIESEYIKKFRPDVLIDVFADETSPTDFLGAKHLVEKGYTTAELYRHKILKKRLFYLKRREGGMPKLTPRAYGKE